MNNLPTTINLPDTLPAYAVEWVGAKFNHPPFLKMKEYKTFDNGKEVTLYGSDAIKRAALDIITKAHLDDNSSSRTEGSVLFHQTNVLIDEIKGDLKNITLPQIRLAFDMGMRGEFGEVRGSRLCAVAYNFYMKSLLRHPDNIRAQSEHLEQIKKLEFKTSDKPLVEKQKQSREGILNYFKSYKENGVFDFNGGVAHSVYDLLDKEFKIPMLTKEEKIECFELAKIEYKSKHETSYKMGYIRKSAIMEILNHLNKDNISLVSIGKRIALKKYFDSIDKLEI